MEQVLASLSTSLHDALMDVDNAQSLLEKEGGAPSRRRDEVDRYVKQVLRSVEENLFNTTVGLRMIMGEEDEDGCEPLR